MNANNANPYFGIETFDFFGRESPNLYSKVILCPPAYIKKLVDKGMLYPDGNRVVKSLNDVACEMQRMGIQPTKNLLYELFMKEDKKKYSKKACKNAVANANSCYVPVEPNEELLALKTKKSRPLLKK